MKIAFLNIYSGIVERGSEIFVHELASRLSLNNEVDVFQCGRGEKVNYKIIQIHGIPKISFLYHFWVFIFTLKCLPYLWKGNFDWMIPINGRSQSIICRIFRFIRGGKILISGHSGVGFDDRINIVLGKPDVFVALTPGSYHWAKNISSKVKVVHIPNGININQFYPNLKQASIPLRKPVILSVSALLPYKQLDLLIKAVKKLRNASLLIIGDGPLRMEIEELGRELLGNRFKLIYYVPHKDIGNYYVASQVFSLPSSHSEAFGLVYLEAMACNIPVVATLDENRKTLIGKGGLLVNPFDIERYSQTLKEALSCDFGDFPRIQAEKYLWDKVAEQYKKVIEK